MALEATGMAEKAQGHEGKNVRLELQQGTHRQDSASMLSLACLGKASSHDIVSVLVPAERRCMEHHKVDACLGVSCSEAFQRVLSRLTVGIVNS